jgi:hypothetical protein
MWYNDATILSGFFSALTIDQARGYSSNHSALYLTVLIDPLFTLEPDPSSLGCVITDGGEQNWTCNFPIYQLTFSHPTPTVEEIELAATLLRLCSASFLTLAWKLVTH